MPYNLATDCSTKHSLSWIHKHRTALIYAHREADSPFLQVKKLTFEQIERLTNRAANLLQSLGAKHSAKLLIRLPNIPEFAFAFLGAIKADLLPIPSSALLKEAELRYQLEYSRATVLVTTAAGLPQGILRERPPALRHILLVTASKKESVPDGCRNWAELFYQASSEFSVSSTSGADPAFGLYTSGTSGKPKLAVHAHQSIPAHDARMRQWLDVQASDVFFNTSALNWSYALTAGWLDAWRHGIATVFYDGPLDAGSLMQVMRQCSVTTLMSVPSLYERMNAAFGENLKPPPNLRVCVSAGEKLRQSTRERFRQFTDLEIYEGLGMTEHSVYLVQPYGSSPAPGACGQALSDDVAVLGEDLQPVALGSPGILATRASCPRLFLGYQDGESWDAARTGDWFLSGDLAVRDAAGNFYFLGRRDDVLTAGGYRIAPTEIEEVLCDHPQVLEAVAVEQRSASGKTFLAAGVVLGEATEDFNSLEAALLAHCEANLANYKVPKLIRRLPALPRTANGKLQRARVRAEFFDSAASRSRRTDSTRGETPPP